MDIEEGWRFSTADFSLQASGKERMGMVLLIREPSQKKVWNLLPQSILEDDEICPPLYVSGLGETLEEAVKDANEKARKARPVVMTTKSIWED